MSEQRSESYRQEELAILYAIEAHPSSIFALKDPNVDEMELALDIKANLAAGFKDLPENIQLFLIEKKAANIKYIKNPTENIQIAVVTIDPHLIKLFLKKATAATRMEALKQDPSVIQYLHDASIDEIRYAIIRGQEYYDLVKYKTVKTDFMNFCYNYKFLI